MENNELTPVDRAIREKLKTLEVPYEKSHWEAFEERLSKETGPSTADAAEALLFSRLGEMEVPYDPGNWALMEKRLEQEEAITDEQFDRNTAERMRRMEAPYDPNHWELMARQIDEAFSFRHWLHRYHVPELVLMILFCFTLFQFFQREERHGPFAPNPARQTAPADMPGPPPAIIPQPVPAPAPIAEARPSPPPAALSVLTPDESQATGFARVESVPASRFQAMYLLPAASRPVAREVMPNLEKYARGSTLAGLKAFRQFLVKPTRLYVGAFSSVDYNFIQAPADEVFQTEGYQTDSTGWSAGMALAVGKGKWQFQTGAAYSKVAYKPILPVQQYGNFDFLVVESFDKINYHFLQAPFQVRRNFLSDRSDWNVYAFGGVLANVVLDANYYINRTEIFTSRTTSTFEDVAGQSRLNDKLFPEGILNGDSFFNNIFLSVSAGVGVERVISPRHRIFFEPRYAHPFFGNVIGPNDDRIHQFSLQLGARMQIK